MTQTLAAPPPGSAPPGSAASPASGQSALFDLLARSWTLEAPVASVALDGAAKAVAFALADGRVALVPLEDSESPVNRIRLELDSGRSTIRPREKPPAAPILTAPLTEGAPWLAPSGKLGVLAAGPDGRVHRVTPRGQVIPLAGELGRDARPAGAFAADGRGRLALAHDGKVDLYDEESSTRISGILTPGTARALAFAPEGAGLAVQHDDGLYLWQPETGTDRLDLPGAGPLAFSPAGGWLAGPDGADGFWLLRRADGASGRIGRFRSPPLSLGFGPKDSTVFAAGAFRLAGWSLATPPLAQESDGALRSGRPGLVLVERVAPHPTRDLVAFGTADGAVALARAGHPDEMALRDADGAPVTALAWSACGLHLILGTARGAAAVVTLPPLLFK